MRYEAEILAELDHQAKALLTRLAVSGVRAMWFNLSDLRLTQS